VVRGSAAEGRAPLILVEKWGWGVWETFDKVFQSVNSYKKFVLSGPLGHLLRYAVCLCSVGVFGLLFISICAIHFFQGTLRLKYLSQFGFEKFCPDVIAFFV
jgi:hypothetical protein